MKKLIIVLLMFTVACSGGNNEAEAPSTLSPTASKETAASQPATAIPASTAIPTATNIPIEYSDGEFLNQPDGNSFRLMNYNINWDSIFPDDDIQNMSYRDINREEEFSRLVNAIQPDVICLEEINPRRDPQQVADMLIEITGDPNWKAVSERDNVIATRYDFIDGYTFDIADYPPELPQAIAMIDLPDENFGDIDIFIICAHFKAAGSSADIKLRQRQADILMNRIGDAMQPGGVIDLPINTPILLVGDFNIYDTDPAYHLVTMLIGDIIDEGRYGPDISPDWDGTDLTDALPSVNNEGLVFDTWRDDGSPYSAGPLDRIIYTDSVLSILNSFILDTTLLSDEALDQVRLEFGDVLFAGELGNYDHLPLIVDFEITITN